MTELVYVSLNKATELPDLSSYTPFKTVFISGRTTTVTTKSKFAGDLITAGCRYFMTIGEECRAWQDAVNLANLQAYNFGAIPDEEIVITTQHDGEKIEDVIWFCKHTAMHPCFKLERTVLLNLGSDYEEQQLMALFHSG